VGKHKKLIQEIPEPNKCWVGDARKVCYGSRSEADGAARLVELEHALEINSLGVYKCEYGDHWHLARQ